MALHTSVNNQPATAAVAVYTIKTVLTAAGWIVKSSADGTTYSSSSDIITSGNSGANGLNNSGAWFRITTPDGYREFVYQRGTGGANTWWVQYSYSAKFTGGSPGATTAPTATDAKNICGTSNAGLTAFYTDNTYMYDVVAMDTFPYCWWAASRTFSNGNSTPTGSGSQLLNPRADSIYAFGSGLDHLSFMDYCVGAPQDTDPYVFQFGYTNLGYMTFLRGNADSNISNQWSAPSTTAGTSGYPVAYYKHGLSGESWVCVAAGNNSITNSPWLNYPGGLPGNPNTGNVELFPIQWTRGNTSLNTSQPFSNQSGLANPLGYKGTSYIFRYTGGPVPPGTLLNVQKTGDWLAQNLCLAMIWNGDWVLL